MDFPSLRGDGRKAGRRKDILLAAVLLFLKAAVVAEAAARGFRRVKAIGTAGVAAKAVMELADRR